MGLFDKWNITNFHITLASNAAIPGGAVSGNLTFKVTKPMTFRSVTIKIVGKEKTHIQETTTTTRTGADGKPQQHSTTTHYNSACNVFKQHVTILGGLKGMQFNGELPVGEYNFPFAFILPANAPPSIPTMGGGAATGDLFWYVKATVNIPFSYADSKTVVPFFVATAMPISQYNSRQPYSSPLIRVPRTCCCCFDSGFTTSQVNLAQNLVVFGRDKALNGTIIINNEESKENTNDITISLLRMCSITAGSRQGKVVKSAAVTRVVTGMKAGESEKRFDFSLPLINHPSLVSCYQGNLLTHFYHLSISCDGDSLFTGDITVSNALDESDRSLPIGQSRGPVVLPRCYSMHIYAPPPGVQPTLPQVPNGFFPPPTGSVQPMRYPVPGAAPPPPPLPMNPSAAAFMSVGTPAYAPPVLCGDSGAVQGVELYEVPSKQGAIHL